MDSKTINNEKDEKRQVENRFQCSPTLAKISFINGITTISITAIYVIIEAIIQPGLIAAFIIYSLILLFAFIGVILSGISFRKGRNIFGIIGFILNFILVAAMPWTLHGLSRILA